MKADEALRSGDPSEALAALQDEVKRKPSDPKLRIFLFQLLSVLGEWKRAMTQLSVARDLDSSTLPMVQTYGTALSCEALRAEVFEGKRTPLIFGEPAEWIASLLQALQMTARGQHAESRSLRERAFEAAPTSAGTIDDHEFEWIADADLRLGPVLEAVINGRYYWVPFDRIAEARIEEPADLRDLVWLPAQFVWANGGEAVGLIPTRYPGSEISDDPQIRMARKTDWKRQGPESFVGVGQRMLATDAGEYPLMDVRALSFRREPANGDTAPR